jgi:hypothetical protein
VAKRICTQYFIYFIDCVLLLCQTEIIPLIFVIGERCRLQTSYSTCGSTIKLTGDCEYESDILAKCQYSIVTTSSEGQIQAVLTTRGRRSLVSRGKTIEECVKVTNEGTFISIADDVCQRCTADYLRSLIPNQTCKGTWIENTGITDLSYRVVYPYRALKGSTTLYERLSNLR